MIEKYPDNVLWILESHHNNHIIHENDNKLITFGESKEEKEKSCNEICSQESKSKKQLICHKYAGYNELDEKRENIRQPVNQTAVCIEGIINEELDREIGRRCYESQTKPK